MIGNQVISGYLTNCYASSSNIHIIYNSKQFFFQLLRKSQDLFFLLP